MRLQLREYQRGAVDRVIESVKRRPVLVAPTGSGKTVMATAIVERLDVPTLWLAHRKELIEQAADRLHAHGLHAGVVMAGCAADRFAPVQVASVHTLARRDPRDWPPAGLIIVDECHHATADSYRRVLDHYADAGVVGLTATPFRLDGRGLGDVFGELVVAAYTDELCDAGVLHAPRVWASRSPDLRGIKVMAGDYQLGALAERSNTVELNGDIVATWLQRAAGKRTVVFAVDVPHSKAIAEAFQSAGVPAEHLDGKTPPAERDAVLARLRDGETQVVANCLVLTEGWDLPALECAVLARPTASLNLHLQMIGRVMRACVGKASAIVLDHAGNHHVHGLVTRRLNYTLDPGEAATSEVYEDSDSLNLRRCAKCGVLHELAAKRCPECGWIAPPQSRRIRTRAGEALVAFDDACFDYRRQVWVAIEGERQAMGYKPGWSYHRFTERFREPPLVVDGELIDPERADGQVKRRFFERLTETAEDRGYRPGWASCKFKEAFGHWPRGFVKTVREERLRERFATACEVPA